MLKHAYLMTLVLAVALTACGDDDNPRPDASDMTVGGDTTTDTTGDAPPTECPTVGSPEDSAAACMDGCDNDLDGQSDCDDFGCTQFCAPVCPTEGPENTAAACSDGCDNDRNGFFDCNENRCRGTSACPVEASNAQCSDMMDNDSNNFMDCDDFSCNGMNNDNFDGVGVCVNEQSNAACSDGVDNNNQDGIDCADPRCQSEGIVVCDGASPASPMPPPSMWEALTNAVCTDEMDNDENNFTDCGDFACANNPDATGCHDLVDENTNGACSDGIDNDKDGLTDCEDFGCVNGMDLPREGIVVCNANREAVPFADDAAITIAANAVCQDTQSNDGNNFTDCMDFGCQDDPLVTVCVDPDGENTNEKCMDGMDNNGNTFIDCNDFSCQKPWITVCDLENTYAECSDGLDNDGNGFADCFDRNCEDTAACR